jgi:hypothetical protein
MNASTRISLKPSPRALLLGLVSSTLFRPNFFLGLGLLAALGSGARAQGPTKPPANGTGPKEFIDYREAGNKVNHL